MDGAADGKGLCAFVVFTVAVADGPDVPGLSGWFALETAELNGCDRTAPADGLREAARVGDGTNFSGICCLGRRT